MTGSARGRFCRPCNNALALAAAEPCAPKFWHFVGAVAAGSVGRQVARWATAKAYNEGGSSSERLAATFAGIAGFWLVGGLTWVALSRQSAMA
jgi:hypothetical protein